MKFNTAEYEVSYHIDTFVFLYIIHILHRFCFVEMAHNSGQLLDAEYVVLCRWYDWIQQNIDIHLDLIGK
jgi:hypothetical protein